MPENRSRTSAKTIASLLPTDAVGRVLRHVVDHSDAKACWIWVGPIAHGYGVVNIRVCGKWRTVRAHRVAYEAMRGVIPDGLVIDHLCMNKRCVNPAHMEVVTNAENTVRATVALNRGRACPHGGVAGSGVPGAVRVRRRATLSCRLCKRRTDREYRARVYRARRALGLCVKCCAASPRRSRCARCNRN